MTDTFEFDHEVARLRMEREAFAAQERYRGEFLGRCHEQELAQREAWMAWATARPFQPFGQVISQRAVAVAADNYERVGPFTSAYAAIKRLFVQARN